MLGWCTKCGVDKMPTVPKEEETGNAAFMVSYYKYDKVKQETGRLADETESHRSTQNTSSFARSRPPSAPS